MEMFKNSLKSVLGTPQTDSQPDGADTVERLVERVMTSTLLDDRRDAVRALRALSRKFRLQVGAQAMDALIKVLEMDRNVAEIVGYALDALCNVVSAELAEDLEEEMQNRVPDDLGVQFTEIFMKKTENITLLLSLLEEFDFTVRWPAVKLLVSLLINKPRELQECILVSPMGVSKLMDLLSESREIIRNEALLLLTHLTKGNANIQKIVAFENGFERLIDIIAEEGSSDGGIVVEDCLVLLLSLLKKNTSNQTFFKEGCFIQKLTPFLNVCSTETGNDTGWSAQKVSNIHLMLQIIRTLVSPSNPQQGTSSSQKVMSSCGLLEQLSNILMASGVPSDILTETINTVAEVIRGHHGNQEYFASVTAPCNPPRPAIVVLLMSMVNEKQPFLLRCAVLYCFQCFLYKNELGQAQIVQTLLPTSAEAGTITAGQLLCGGLASADPPSNWFVAVALMHAMVDSTSQKEHLLRVQLVNRAGGTPTFLMQQLTSMLMQSGKTQPRIGLLMLLCTWLANCPLAVSQFLGVPTNVPYLTSQIVLTEGDDHEVLIQGLCAFLFGICVQFNDNSVPSFSRESLCQLIAKRIGTETFFDKLGLVSKHEAYSEAAHKPQLRQQKPSEILFDYEFCRLFKSLEGTIIKVATPKSHESLLNGPETNLTEAEHGLLQQYKGLIREQDQQLGELKTKLEDLQAEHRKSMAQVDEMSSTIQQLKDQNSLLKAQRGTAGNQMGTIGSDVSAGETQLRERLEALEIELDSAKRDLAEKNTLVESLSSRENGTAENASELSRLNDLVAEQCSEIEKLSEKSKQLQSSIDVQSSDRMTANSGGDAALLQEKNDLQERLSKVNEKYQKLEEEKSQLEKEKSSLQTDLDNYKKEQEDLLILLTEQDNKLETYKNRLQALGETVADDYDEGIKDDEEEEEQSS